MIARVLKRPGEGRLCLDRLPRSAGGGSCGMTALQHFLYRATARTQFVMPAFSPPLNLPELREVGSLSAASNMLCSKQGFDAGQRVQEIARPNSAQHMQADPANGGSPKAHELSWLQLMDMLVCCEPSVVITWWNTA